MHIILAMASNSPKTARLDAAVANSGNPQAPNLDRHLIIQVTITDDKVRDTSQKSLSLLGAARHFARQHAFPAGLMVAFLIAGVTLLMNCLLWTGLPEHIDDEEVDETLFSVRTILTTQALDIVRLASCPGGRLASTPLDRTISIWLDVCT